MGFGLRLMNHVSLTIASAVNSTRLAARSPDGRAAREGIYFTMDIKCRARAIYHHQFIARARSERSRARLPRIRLRGYCRGVISIQPCLYRIFRQHSLPGPSRKLLRPPFSNRFHQVATCATVFLIFPQHSGAMAARRASGVVAASAMRRGACGAVARAAVPHAAGSGRACSTVAAFPLDKELPG